MTVEHINGQGGVCRVDLGDQAVGYEIRVAAAAGFEVVLNDIKSWEDDLNQDPGLPIDWSA